MDQQQQAIRDQQRDSWDRFSGGWKKWDELTMAFMQPMADMMIGLLHPNDGEQVLDIAAGTGEPGLTIAQMIPSGRVTITDLSEQMLAIAREHASQRGIDNIATTVCDVCELPFADQQFDAISCRFGFMFFPDMEMAAREMYRVLKPGGRMTTAVWDVPEKNFWITAMMGTIQRYVPPPPPVPGAPGMFRCAEPGLMRSIFGKAGFKNVSEERVASKLPAGTAKRYWDMLTEIGAPIVAALSKADDTTRETIRKEVLEAVAKRYPEPVAIDASAIVLHAIK